MNVLTTVMNTITTSRVDKGGLLMGVLLLVTFLNV